MSKAPPSDAHAEITAESISEYVHFVTSISNDWSDDDGFITPWFRGVGNFKHKLQPRLYRDQDIDHVKAEAKIRVAFSSRALPYVTSLQKRETWNWYFLMQHYGVPTRLLDWTESALVALYFALYSHDPALEGVPIVWVLDPFALNSATIRKDEILIPSDRNFAEYLPEPGSRIEAKLPVAVHPEYTDRRMTAQQSKFTMHGSITTPLEDMPELADLRKKRQLTRVSIAVKDRDDLEQLKDALALLGIRSATVFPDLHGLALDIGRDYTPTQK